MCHAWTCHSSTVCCGLIDRLTASKVHIQRCGSDPRKPGVAVLQRRSEWIVASPLLPMGDAESTDTLVPQQLSLTDAPFVPPTAQDISRLVMRNHFATMEPPVHMPSLALDATEIVDELLPSCSKYGQRVLGRRPNVVDHSPLRLMMMMGSCILYIVSAMSLLKPVAHLVLSLTVATCECTVVMTCQRFELEIFTSQSRASGRASERARDRAIERPTDRAGDQASNPASERSRERAIAGEIERLSDRAIARSEL